MAENYSQSILTTIPLNAVYADKSMMTVRGLHKAFGGNQILKGITFDLKAGEIVLLRGSNGSGKTTLLNILTGNEEPDAGVIRFDTNHVRDNFYFPRARWRSLMSFSCFTPERVARNAIGRTWQDVRLFSTQTLLNNVAVASPSQIGENPIRALLAWRKSRRCEKLNCKESAGLLASLGMNVRGDSSADKVSFGQSKRTAIARAIRGGARILFLDEPLAGLDAEGVEEIRILLTELARKGNISLVIVEHGVNIRRLLDLASSVWNLHDGKISAETITSVRKELDSEPSKGVVNLVHSFGQAKRVFIEEKLLDGAFFTIMRNWENKFPNEEPVIELRDLVVRIGQQIIVGMKMPGGYIKGLSLKLYRGDLGILQAPNGWGKSTLVKAIAGLLPLERGEILLEGKPIHTIPTWERICSGLSIVQSCDNDFDSLTVMETFALRKIEVPTHLKRFAHRKLSTLSGGERQQVALESANMANLRVRIWDEPFVSLDEATILQLRDRIFDTAFTTLLLVPAAL